MKKIFFSTISILFLIPVTRVHCAGFSGIVLTPTAYRGSGENSIGAGLDFNAAYYIGRLYGKNSYSWTLEKKNYIDRIGIWLLMADAKLQVQSEKGKRPALSFGAIGCWQFRDSPQPTLNRPSVSVKIDDKNTHAYASAYGVISKKFFSDRILLNAGYMDGDFTKIIYQLSEFLSDEALFLNGYSSPSKSNPALFGGVLWMLKKDFPVGFEVIIPQGAPQKAKLFNVHLGTLLKLNFELSYLTFDGGWDLMGMFQFRYSYFPKSK